MSNHLREVAAICALALPLSAHLPDGYVDELFVDGLTAPVGVTFDANGRAYIWERAGRVYLVENSELVQPPLLDISEEVGSWRDFGMLGFALDPEFATNGDFYCYYVVDRHHLIYFGTPQYDPNANWTHEATIGRVTRFSADPATGFTTVIPGSRKVLLGDSIDTGIPILFESHGTGSVVFGGDGSLLVSSGDGASYNNIDRGSLPATYWQTAVADGIIREEENVGAFRSQMIGSLSGKILRLDPATGDGLPSNPFFRPDAPRSPQSRVWSLGLRNPFRMSLRPGTGNPNPAFGDPGVLYIGDVGWDRWEELHVVASAGENLGWPLFGSLGRDFRYTDAITLNLDAPNPLYAQGACDEQYFQFQELLRQEREDHDPIYPNRCDPATEIPAETPTFMHHRAAIDWSHQAELARVPIFVAGEARRATLGEPGCPVLGESFRGFCAIGGTWLGDVGFGAFGNTYFLMDFSANWARALRFDEQDELQEVLDFGHIANPVYAAQDPMDGSVVYASVSTNTVRRLRFTGAGNVAPQGVLAAADDHGVSPLTVRFDGSASSDPEGMPLAFQWDFGDGGVSTAPSPVYVFRSSDAAPPAPTTRDVTLTVSDPEGREQTSEIRVHLDNSPPQVAITSFENGARYSVTESTELALEAQVRDSESRVDNFSFAWQLFLHHDNHDHPEPVDRNRATSVLLTPTPCGTSFYAYRVELTVTDPQGLATTVEHWLLPDCNAGPVEISASVELPRMLPGREVTLAANIQLDASRVDFYVGGDRVGTTFEAPHEVSWVPPRAANFVVSALAQSSAGSASSPGMVLEVREPKRIECTIDDTANDAQESSTGKVELETSGLHLGEAGTIGVRFPLDVPHRALIQRAYLDWTSIRAGDTPTTLTLRAEAADSATPIVSTRYNLSGRTTTSSEVTWEVQPWRYGLASGARQRTPDLSKLLQEFVDRPGFVSGSAALLIITGQGSRAASAFDPLNPERAARLVVEYIDAAPRPRGPVRNR